MSDSIEDNTPIRLTFQRENKKGEWESFIILREYRLSQLADVMTIILNLDKKMDDKHE